jgi:hypothetical protein
MCEDVPVKWVQQNGWQKIKGKQRPKAEKRMRSLSPASIEDIFEEAS